MGRPHGGRPDHHVNVSRARLAGAPAAVWRALRRARNASWAARAEYVKVAVLACVTEVAVRTIPLPRLVSAYGLTLGPEGNGHNSGEDELAAGELPPWARQRLRVVVHVMRRWPVQGECLRYGLVAGQRLRALHPELRLGVTKKGSTIVAHAWLVIGGRSLDPTSGDYAELLGLRP